MRVTITGHRPDKLFPKDRAAYSHERYLQLVEFCKGALEWYIKRVKATNPDETVEFNIGMALGFDMAFARACVEMGIPFYAYIPFRGQERLWKEEWQHTEYKELLAKAVEIITAVDTDNYHPAHMHTRNHMMVDHSERVLTLWDGSNSGGTAACIVYTQRRGKKYDTIWDYWIKFRDRLLF
jgi:uncharacterized phage-like protein YoqJ